MTKMRSKIIDLRGTPQSFINRGGKASVLFGHKPIGHLGSLKVAADADVPASAVAAPETEGQ